MACILCIMQWCLPCLRQHGGRLASAAGANCGAISIQLKIVRSRTAVARRIGWAEVYKTYPAKDWDRRHSGEQEQQIGFVGRVFLTGCPAMLRRYARAFGCKARRHVAPLRAQPSGIGLIRQRKRLRGESGVYDGSIAKFRSGGTLPELPPLPFSGRKWFEANTRLCSYRCRSRAVRAFRSAAISNLFPARPAAPRLACCLGHPSNGAVTGAAGAAFSPHSGVARGAG